MPRVVQVVSRESNKGSEQISDVLFNPIANDDDVVNRNYNQRSAMGTDSITNYMRFNVNYAQYNVEYIDSEDEPYCLRRVVNGEIKKFKKDARTWLHKSSDRKRKLDCGMPSQRNEDKENSTPVKKNTKLESNNTVEKSRNSTNLQHFITSGGFEAYRTPAQDDDDDDVKSDLSSLADSEADLTYSEESSPTLVGSYIDARDRQVPVGPVDNRYRVHPVSSSSSEGFKSVIQDQDENESHNNNMNTCPARLDVTRIAPAITMEAESMHDTLLDCAVNRHQTTGVRNLRNGRRRLQAEITSYNEMYKIKSMKRKQEKRKYRDVSYNLRSLKRDSDNFRPRGNSNQHCNYTYRKVRQRKGSSNADQCQQTEPVVQKTEISKTLIPTSVSLSTAPDFRGLAELPGCSKDCDDVVPSLFALASLAMYKIICCGYPKI